MLFRAILTYCVGEKQSVTHWSSDTLPEYSGFHMPPSLRGDTQPGRRPRHCDFFEYDCDLNSQLPGIILRILPHVMFAYHTPFIIKEASSHTLCPWQCEGFHPTKNPMCCPWLDSVHETPYPFGLRPSEEDGHCLALLGRHSALMMGARALITRERYAAVLRQPSLSKDIYSNI